MRHVRFELDTGEYALATMAAEKIGLTVDEFAACCVQMLAHEPAKMLEHRTVAVENSAVEWSDTAMTPTSVQSPSWAEAIAIAKKRAGQK